MGSPDGILIDEVISLPHQGLLMLVVTADRQCYRETLSAPVG
jgi:hypothetical protein